MSHLVAFKKSLLPIVKEFSWELMSILESIESRRFEKSFLGFRYFPFFEASYFKIYEEMGCFP
jgi:hypothetical protein